MSKKEFSVEDSFVELEEIVSKLESDDTSLNDAVKLYSQGVELIKACKDNLEGVEKEIIVLGQKGDSNDI